MMEFKLWRQLKREPYSEYRDSDSITVKELKCMYGIYQKYYANTRYEIFERDFLEKPVFSLFLNLKTNKLLAFLPFQSGDYHGFWLNSLCH